MAASNHQDDPTSSAPGQGPPLPALADRAFDLLESRGGDVSAGELVAWVFGAARAGPWGALLDTVLGADARFARRGDRWHLAGGGSVAAGHALAGEEMVALALTTTGPDPRRHRIVRLVAARFAADSVTARFDILVNPRRRLPRYLVEAARLTQEEADEAVAFAQIAEPLREFLGHAPIVAYGARLALAFLAAELARAELPGLINPAIELDALARALLPAARKPSLVAIAEQLGISHPRPNYPPADADVAARVAAALLDLAGERGLADLGGVVATGGGDARGALADRRWLGDVPTGPGVYTIEDQQGAVLYVGKAVDLRRRLGAYFGRPFGLHRQLEGLAARAARVDWRSAPSDLEARLLEARLIRRHRPPFNVQRRARPRSLLIRAAQHDRVPRIQLARLAEADGALYLGPFRSERAARAALSLARAIYPDACLRRVVDHAAQRQAVQAAVRVLSGQTSEALTALRARMRERSARADLIGVERARDAIRRVLGFALLPSPLLGISVAEPILVIEPPSASGARRAHLVDQGHLLASTDLEPGLDTADPSVLLRVFTDLQTRAAGPDHEEDAHIVTQWLGELGPDHAIRPLSRLTPV